LKKKWERSKKKPKKKTLKVAGGKKLGLCESHVEKKKKETREDPEIPKSDQGFWGEAAGWGTHKKRNRAARGGGMGKMKKNWFIITGRVGAKAGGLCKTSSEDSHGKIEENPQQGAESVAAPEPGQSPTLTPECRGAKENQKKKVKVKTAPVSPLA